MNRAEAALAVRRGRMALAEIGSSTLLRFDMDPHCDGGWGTWFKGERWDGWRAHEVAKVEAPCCWECSQSVWDAGLSTGSSNCEATWWLVIDCGRPR